MNNLITEARELCELHRKQKHIPMTMLDKTLELCDALEKAEAEANFWKSKFKTLQQCDIHNLTDCDFCQTLISANAEVERLREAQRWIPVTERLPETSGAYWVNLHQEDEDGNDADFCIEAWYQVNSLLFAPKEVGWQLLNEWYEFSGQMRQYISHWMPLPAPPEEGAEK